MITVITSGAMKNFRIKASSLAFFLKPFKRSIKASRDKKKTNLTIMLAKAGRNKYK
jgi:hypothetical protein